MTCFFSDGILDGIEHLSQRKSKENQSLGLLIDNRMGVGLSIGNSCVYAAWFPI